MINFIRKNRIFETDTFIIENISSQEISSYLSTYTVADGAFGLEWYYSSEFDKIFFFGSRYRELEFNNSKSVKMMIPNDNTHFMSCYYVYSNKKSFFPFNMKYTDSLFYQIKNNLINIKDEKILIQIIAKKINNGWQEKFGEQYEDYVNGIESPSHNILLRKFQLFLLETVCKLEGGYRKNPLIEQVEDKLKEEGYYFEMRFVVYDGDKDSCKSIGTKIQLGLSHQNYANEWKIYKSRNNHEFIQNIQLRKFSKNKQILSTTEILPFFIISKNYNNIQEIHNETIPLQQNEEVDSKNDILEIFPRGQKIKRKDDSMIAVQFNNALRKLGLIDNQDVMIQSIQHGSTVCRVLFNLPNGLKLSTLQKEETRTNIQTELALRSIGFEQGEHAGTAVLMLPQEERDKVFLRDLLDSEEFQKFVKSHPLPFILGANQDGETVFDCLERIKHLLIAGATGSGKSVFLNLLLMCIILYKSPKEVQMLLIDPKKVELSGYSKHPHVINVVVDNQKAVIALQQTVAKMEERYETLSKEGCRNISQYNKKAKNKMPYLIVVIDELADLIMTSANVEQYVILLAQKARAAGIHLILCTQKPIREVVTGLIKGNIYSRVCFMCNSSTDYKVALDEVPKGFKLLGKGDGVYRFEGLQELKRFQGALIGNDDDEQDEIIEKLSSYWKGNYNNEKIDLESPPHETDYDKLKSIIAETGETRISELQKIMKMNIHKVSEMMKELVNDGWLKKPESRSKGYEMLLSEEERKEYLRQKN